MRLLVINASLANSFEAKAILTINESIILSLLTHDTVRLFVNIFQCWCIEDHMEFSIEAVLDCIASAVLFILIFTLIELSNDLLVHSLFIMKY